MRDVHPHSLSTDVRERHDPTPRKPIHELRQYGIGAQILSDLGVKKMTLLSNTKRSIVGLDGYGITLVGQSPIVEV
jgi:3,4-dihydroxy 2-butanone 4-phosphate synthase/GTP cyclohydrolase II